MATDDTPDATQAEVIAFLSTSASHGENIVNVEIIETHGALVFLAGKVALKIKRAVRVAYFDFSTLARREAVCRRELEINRPNAPDIYCDIVAITREADGALAIGGRGTPVEWAIKMVRFDQQALLSTMAERSGIDDRLAAELARMMALAHAAAAPRTFNDAAEHMQGIVDGIDRSLQIASAAVPGLADLHGRFMTLAGAQLLRVAPLLRRRADAGLVRRCHGDAHLGNIVLWKGRPQLFDAIEFDENLATIDLLYDLAFLLMDLDRRGERRAARIVLERYLGGTGRQLDIEGLAAMPFFLGVRAAIRAMVAFDRARLQNAAEKQATQQHGLETLSRAIEYLEPPPARLIAVGGLSGTGKTTLARELAPLLLPVPGALHLRSDLLRKELAGVREFDRLPAAAYTRGASDAVYRALLERARLALQAGHSVVVDAVFAQAEWRVAVAGIAAAADASFDGIWLEASADLLKARVAARTGDASDATPDVVDQQLAAETGAISWHRVEATGDPAAVLAAAVRAINPQS